VKVLLINPSTTFNSSEKSYKSAGWPPLGILYIATVLKNAGVDVSVLDQEAQGYDYYRALDWIKSQKPDVVGFSTFQSSAKMTMALSKGIKRFNPDIKVVLGGYYATFNDTRILIKYPYIDTIIRGEGEITMKDYVSTLKSNNVFRDIPGLTYVENGNIKQNPNRKLIKDIDCLPFPDRELLEVEYQSRYEGLNLAVKKFTTISSSRGCPHNCNFCSCHNFFGNIWRPRSEDNTVEEMKHLHNEGYEQFFFVDDSFTIDVRRVEKLCKRIREEGLDIDWACEGRVDCGSYDIFRGMSKAGCKIMFFGVESANQDSLDYFNKNITPSQSAKTIKKARRAGIDIIIGSFILGSPGESKEDIMNTIKFAKKIDIDFPQFYILHTYPGMKIWKDLVDNGIVDPNLNWESVIRIPDLGMCGMTSSEIIEEINTALSDFFSRPGFLSKQIMRSVKSGFRRGIIRKNFNELNPYTLPKLFKYKNIW